MEYLKRKQIYEKLKPTTKWLPRKLPVKLSKKPCDFIIFTFKNILEILKTHLL